MKLSEPHVKEQYYSDLPNLPKQHQIGEETLAKVSTQTTSTIELPLQLVRKMNMMEQRDVIAQQIERNSCKVLFLTTDLPELPIRSNEEDREIKSAIKASRYRDKFEFHYCGATQSDHISGLLSDVSPNIVHFACHGDNGNLILRSCKGKPESFPHENIITKFKKALNENIRIHCVYLNTCYSAELAENLSKYVGCAIGISDEIEDSDAIKVAKEFYELIGNGWTIDNAFGSAQANVLSKESKNKFKIFYNHNNFQAFRLVGDKSIGLSAPKSSRGVIELTLSNDSDLQSLKDKLAIQLNISQEQLVILVIRPGSIKISIELPTEALQKLQQLYANSLEELRELQIQDIDFKPNVEEIFRSVSEPTRTVEKMERTQVEYRYRSMDIASISHKELMHLKNQVAAGTSENFMKEASTILPEASRHDLEILQRDLEQHDVNEIVSQLSRFQNKSQEQ